MRVLGPPRRLPCAVTRIRKPSPLRTFEPSAAVERSAPKWTFILQRGVELITTGWAGSGPSLHLQTLPCIDERADIQPESRCQSVMIDDQGANGLVGMRRVRCISPEEGATEPNNSEKYRRPSLQGEKRSRAAPISGN